MPDDDRYSLTELADLAGVTPRTVRYYLAQGLLPAVGQTGPGSKYGEGHLSRLRLIRRLQAEHLPLAEIRRRLERLSDEDIRTLAAEEDPVPPADSALDYLRTVLGGANRSPIRLAEVTLPDLVPPPGMPRMPRRNVEGPMPAPALSTTQTVRDMPAAGTPATDSHAVGPDRSQWERIALAPDVELHIRRPLTRAHQKGIDRLVTIARELLEEDRS